MRKIVPIIRGMRPRYWPASILTLLIGVLIAEGNAPILTILIAAVTFGPIMGGATYLLNHYYDRHIDRINPRTRNLPISKLEVSPLNVKRASVILYAVGILPAYSIGLEILVLYLAMLGLGVSYSAPPVRLKSKLLPGILTSAVGYGFASIYAGWLLVKNVSPAPLIIALPISLPIAAAHLYKGVEDRVGDMVNGVSTVATRGGRKLALSISWLLSVSGYVLFAVFSFLGWLAGEFAYLGLGVPLISVVYASISTEQIAGDDVRKHGWVLAISLVVTLAIVLAISVRHAPIL
ncbi:hypothetical protein AKJ65_04115 [candidate division MSBL1 archaeon SCGC-AAA259E19]|uniref:Ubiquinone biosynthesis protein UbiA n=1 Tax=candidate division MSBL1 archaeon SCGC-AAA259E19 TaxID=1698264 RepID=A0A133UK13_9EURY|nr:hypothetical protein AKJ65_04115 [candidate division MSBL1 archaeon SCGC-AAA259E19]